MKRTLFVTTLILLIILGILLGFPQSEVNAHMFRGNLHHTGFYESSVPKNNSILWSFDSGNSIESSPVIVENRVYFGGENGKVYCLDASYGNEIWSFFTENEVDSTPTVADGVVYVGSADTKLYAIDAQSGYELWNYTLASPFAQIFSSPTVAYGKIFFGASDYNFYALNTTTRSVEWIFPTGDEIFSSPAVEWPYVYTGSNDGNVYCLWIENGTERWNFSSDFAKSPHRVYSSPMLYNGRLYIGSEDNNLYSLDALTGDLIWNFSSPHYIYSSAAAHNGKIFIHTLGIPSGFLYALPEEDPNGDGMIASSEVIWSFETRDWDGGSSPALADGKVLVGSNFLGIRDGKLFCLNESTGEEIWNFTAQSGIVSSPALANGVVYFGSYDGSLYAVGGLAPAPLMIQVLPEFTSIKAGRVMGISFVVTHRGAPVEGAFINVDISGGNLSQQGASTFPDGSQRIKYTAPMVDENTTITILANAVKFGYPEGQSTAQFTVEPPSSYKDVKSQSGFSISKYWLYIVLIIVLIILNAIIIVLSRRKRSGDKITEEESDSDDLPY